ncbi:unnamed protein product [Ixodes hexagonus]
MEDEVSPKVIKKTQDLLGLVIKKPPLQEKLLKKPPFRFLHDIIHNVIKASKFLDGLYTPDELASENIKDKESKIAFLQKAIDAVIMVTGTHLTVRPSKIVSGHEAEKTNEFLQLMAKAASKKLDSSEAVKRVLAGEKPAVPSKPDKKDATKKKELTRTSKKQATDTDNSRSRSKKTTDAENGEEKKPTSLAPAKEKSSSVRSSSKTRAGKTKSNSEHGTKTNKDPDKNAASSSAVVAEEANEVVTQGTSERPRTSTRKKVPKDASDTAVTTTDIIPSEKQNGIGNTVIVVYENHDINFTNVASPQRTSVQWHAHSTERASLPYQTRNDKSKQRKIFLKNCSMVTVICVGSLEVTEDSAFFCLNCLTRSSLRSSRPRSSRPAAPRIRKKEEASAESAVPSR